MLKRLFAALFALLIVGAVVAGGSYMYAIQQLKGPGPLQAAKNVVIPRGLSAQAIGSLLEKEGVIGNKDFFRLQYFLVGQPELKAGEYSFAPADTLQTIVGNLAEGKVFIRNFTVAEGLTSVEIVKLLEDEPALTGAITEVPTEGSLLPETYRYSHGESRASILARMKKAMEEALTNSWAARNPELPLKDMRELVVLASIVEKETGIAAERPRVAGVFINRLNKGMPLQTDPTVSYGITMGRVPLGRNLTYNDLARPTPYNTYTINGLPPGPIANPGKASLMAAAQPEKNDFIYFVADGTGGHRFAITLDEHNKNVANWRNINKKN